MKVKSESEVTQSTWIQVFKKLQSEGRLVQVMSKNIHIIPPYSLRPQPFKGMMPCDCSLMLRTVRAQVQM